MSSEKTPNLELHKWEATDYVQRTEFNDNFGKIDDHAKQVTEQLADIAISVKTFGAVGDGITDDTDAINKAIDFLKLIPNPTLYFPKSLGYCVSKTIVIPNGINVNMDDPLIYIGTENIPALVIGVVEEANQNRVLKLQVERKFMSDWSSENSVGIRFTNTYESDITIMKASKFTIGAQFQGDGKGFVYNEVSLYSIIGNKIGLDLTSKNGGWCNENNFYGGRIAVLSSQGTGKSRYGIRITSEDGYIQNNNVFNKPNIELKEHVASPNEAIPVLIEYGSQNTFKTCRTESNNDVFARITNGSTENKFHIGYGSLNTKLDDQSRYPASKLEMNRSLTRERDGQLLYSLHNIQKRACYYDGSTSYHVPGMFSRTSGNNAFSKSIQGLTVTDDYVELGTARALGVVVDSRVVKKFLVRRENDEGYPGRVSICCYDKNGRILTNTGSNHPYVKSMSYTSFNYDTNYGGSYRIVADYGNDIYVHVNDDVAKIAIMFNNGTQPCRLRGFAIYGLDGKYASVSSGYEDIIPGVNIGILKPTAGTWNKGKIVLNDNKVELGNIGSKYVVDAWECIADGTPGTWIEKRSLTGN